MALRRVFACTALHKSSAYLQLRAFSRSPVFQKTETSADDLAKVTNKYAKNPECLQVDCEPPVRRADANLSSAPTVKLDEVAAYSKCPPPVQVKKLSCADIPMDAKPPKRKRKPFVPASSCKKPKAAPEAPDCPKLKKELCPKIQMHNCPKGRNPPKCEKLLKREDCQRIPAPFPAYSECVKPAPNKRKTECECLVKERVCL